MGWKLPFQYTKVFVTHFLLISDFCFSLINSLKLFSPFLFKFILVLFFYSAFSLIFCLFNGLIHYFVTFCFIPLVHLYFLIFILHQSSIYSYNCFSSCSFNTTIPLYLIPSLSISCLFQFLAIYLNDLLFILIYAYSLLSLLNTLICGSIDSKFFFYFLLAEYFDFLLSFVHNISIKNITSVLLS